jgi:transcriptional regulator with XRE-family HTH domain
MPRKAASKRVAAVLKAQRRKVGEYIRKRRRELSLSQRDLVRMLGYKSAVSISDVEIGRTRVPFRRMYQYADALRLSRDEFVRFVVGELQGSPAASARPPRGAKVSAPSLTVGERRLLDDFRRLPSAARHQVWQQIRSYLGTSRRGGRRRGGRRRR